MNKLASTFLLFGSLFASAVDGNAELIRLSVKRVIGPNGEPSPWQAEDVLRWVEELNYVYARQSSLRFSLIEMRTIQDPGSSPRWYDASVQYVGLMEAQARSAPSRFGWRTDAVNVYLVRRIDQAGGVCSFPGGSHQEIILVQPSILNSSVGLGHELGHYFNLRHTHANYEGSAGGCVGGFIHGDCVSDTPDDADPRPCFQSLGFSTQCHAANLARLYPIGSVAYNTLRYNVMSYHGSTSHTRAHLTRGQANRMRSTASTARSHVVAPAGSSENHWFFGDFDGDGRCDKMRYVQGVGSLVFLFDGAAFRYRGVWSTAGVGQGPVGWYVGDFDGDGRDDVCRQHSMYTGNPQTDVLLSTGSSFRSSPPWTTTHFGDGQQGWYVGDYDRDGRDDLMRWRRGVGCEVFRSTGAAFQLTGTWSGAGNGIGPGFYVGDFDGDGRDDIARYQVLSSGVPETRVYLSTGTSFSASAVWTYVDFGFGPSGWYVGDFNGDGRDDIFRYLPGASGADMFLSNGSRFVSGGSFTTAGIGFGPTGWHTGDFNRDGLTDLYRVVIDRTALLLSTGDEFISAWGRTFYTPTGQTGDLVLAAATSGSGDLALLLDGLPGNVVFGATLVSANTSTPIGMGPFYGVTLDALTGALLASTPSPTNPFFFIPPFTPGAYPLGAFLEPPGRIPTGWTADLVVLVGTTNPSEMLASNVVRVDF